MCREMQQYIADFRVNINVSYIQIMRESMANKILSAIKANNLRPESICIEMTESGFMDMTPCFCSFRKKLDENNIQFIIDDFGTGYSNLRYAGGDAPAGVSCAAAALRRSGYAGRRGSPGPAGRGSPAA